VATAKIWGVLAGGALGLFAATYALENNASLFPAIARANRAMRAGKEAAAEEPAVPEAEVVEGGMPPMLAGQVEESRRLAEDEAAAAAESAALESSVLEGLGSARERVLGQRDGPAAEPSEPAGEEPTEPVLSEYGVPLPTDRAPPVVSGKSAEENREDAQDWIAAYRARVSGEARAAEPSFPATLGGDGGEEEAVAAEGDGAGGAWDGRAPVFELSGDEIEASGKAAAEEYAARFAAAPGPEGPAPEEDEDEEVLALREEIARRRREAEEETRALEAEIERRKAEREMRALEEEIARRKAASASE